MFSIIIISSIITRQLIFRKIVRDSTLYRVIGKCLRLVTDYGNRFLFKHLKNKNKKNACMKWLGQRD